MEERGNTRKWKIPWFLIIVAIVLATLLVIYGTLDISDVNSCESDSDCMIYQVSGSGEYVCANKDVGNNFNDKLLMFKYAQGEGMQKRPENCVCTDDVCSPEE